MQIYINIFLSAPIIIHVHHISITELQITAGSFSASIKLKMTITNHVLVFEPCKLDIYLLRNMSLEDLIIQTPGIAGSGTEVELVNKPVFAGLVFSQEQEDDLRHAFNLLDYKGEGKINASDFRVAIKALGYEPTAEELQHMINGVDKGGSGKLSFENFQTLIMRKVMSLDSDGDIMKSFRLFDTDDSGSISFENLKTVTEILGIYLTDEEIEEMMDDADKDYDGEVSVHEFMKMIKSSVNIVTP